MLELVDELARCRERGEPACLVTVVNVRGSAPREPGAQMLVTADGIVGTIGGGQLEYSCTQTAVSGLRGGQSESAWQRTYPLGSSCGQCCGGVVDVMYELAGEPLYAMLDLAGRLRDERERFVIASSPVPGRGGHAIVCDGRTTGFGLDEITVDAVAEAVLKRNDTTHWDAGTRTFYRLLDDCNFNLALFGAGHVGSALAGVLATLPCRVRWIDNRRDIFPASLPANVTAIASLSSSPAAEVHAMPPGSFYLVMTHSHALDFEICEQVLRRGDARYCGLIGSLSKRRRCERLMRQQGLTPVQFANLTCPIGIDGIGGKRPAEIAIAVAAELLQIQGQGVAARSGRFSENVHVI